MPLSWGGLWLAETISPPAAPRRRIAPGIAGVGQTPRVHTSRPAAVRPAVSAATSIGPLQRESIPINTGPDGGSTWPHQKPTCMARAGLSWAPTRPRMPSVPKPATPLRRGWPTGWEASSAMDGCRRGAQVTSISASDGATKSSAPAPPGPRAAAAPPASQAASSVATRASAAAPNPPQPAPAGPAAAGAHRAGWKGRGEGRGEGRREGRGEEDGIAPAKPDLVLPRMTESRRR